MEQVLVTNWRPLHAFTFKRWKPGSVLKMYPCEQSLEESEPGCSSVEFMIQNLPWYEYWPTLYFRVMGRTENVSKSATIDVDNGSRETSENGHMETGELFLCTDFFFTATILRQGVLYFPLPLLRIQYDSIETSALPTKVCLYCSTSIPHTYSYVYQTSPNFSDTLHNSRDNERVWFHCCKSWDIKGLSGDVSIPGGPSSYISKEGVMPHMVRAQRTHCLLRYISSKNSSRYVFALEINSGHPCIYRTFDGAIELRNYSTALSDIMSIEKRPVNIESIETSGKWPWLKLPPELITFKHFI